MANRSAPESFSRGLRVAVVDGGARGNAIAQKYGESPQVRKILAFPGNDGMKEEVQTHVQTFPDIATTNVTEIVRKCNEYKVDLVDVAQDNAIAAGLVNALMEAGIPTVGPTQEAGQIEWSKSWAREFGERHKLPQPQWAQFSDRDSGVEYIHSLPEQKLFIKADGLLGGKGALGALNKEQAISAVAEVNDLGAAGQTYLVEEWLGGKEGETSQEFSMFAISDGKTFQLFGQPIQDHKRLRNGDTGPQTGGTGVSTPTFAVTEELLPQIHHIFHQTFEGLKAEGRAYKGVLYLGGMVVKSNNGKAEVRIVEFNARPGDPEAQVLYPGMQNNWADVGMAVAEGHLDQVELKHDGKTRVGIVGMAQGYPDNYQAVKGKEIFGLKEARKMPGVQIFAGGVKTEDGKHFVNGGRLFTIVGEGKDVVEAQLHALQAMIRIFIADNGLHFRTDIGWRDINTFYKLLAQEHHT